MTADNAPHGSIQVSPRAIATIAYQAAVQSYGVVGLAAKNFLDGVSNFIVKDPTHGIEVSYDEGAINIDIYIVVEYGTNIKTIAASVAQTVRYSVEKALGLPIQHVNVHVQGLRVSAD
ncbi:MAG: Asp23/Gls24 family envelope stress response protein [Anaerolineales bacterium]|nr:Asp23/Gls24 family envelope stress response protein [Anaerolineales bacterium]MCL4257344.1 Asp23/Gls24 family envelope stress response protein [Anaerolineales bacterium]QYK51652.1 MAG: Asp23/Gls24 family envelope stress response protein [Anaerolineales bacterium]